MNLTQQANPNAEIIVPRLGSEGIRLVSEFMESLSEAIPLEAQINYRYTKIINDPRFVAPISSSEPNIRNCWIDSYQALNMIARLYRASLALVAKATRRSSDLIIAWTLVSV